MVRKIDYSVALADERNSQRRKGVAPPAANAAVQAVSVACPPVVRVLNATASRGIPQDRNTQIESGA